MKMKLFVSLCSLFFATFLMSQRDVEFDKQNFKDQKSEFKEAYKSYKEGSDLLEPVPFPRYLMALPYLEKAYEFNPNSSDLNYKLGLCYLNSNYKFKSLEFFEKSFALNPNKHPDIQYYMGRGQHLNKNWDDAIKRYKAHRNRLDQKKDLAQIMEVNKLIFECESGKKLMKDPVRVWIDNMGKNVNSKYPEYGMIMTADASEVFFTSRRSSSTGGSMDNGSDLYMEDVYSSLSIGRDKWSPARNIGSPINTKEHDAAVALSPDGSKMVVYIDDKGDGNLYECERKGSEWSKPQIFNKEISGPYHEASAWYSSDGQLLYFVSDRPLEGKSDPKDRDIYFAKWDETKGKWLNVKRLPDNVNTQYDEDGIFLHPDGKTLYFSSKGHNSIGGYDVFKTVKQSDGSWSDPVNMGFPISTPDDDIFFVVAANGRHAYMTSFREDGYGDKDLYKLTLLGAEKKPVLSGEDNLLANQEAPVSGKVIEPKVEIKSSQVAILKGIIRDDKTKKPVEAIIELIDNEKNEVIARFNSNASNGKYLVSLPAGRNYGIAVMAEEYLFHSENFEIASDAQYLEVEKNIDLKQASVGTVIVLRNIFFDYNKYTLRDESQNELDRLIKLLNENPKLRIEISGHTDTRGSATYNKDLSQNRAQSVVTYLVQKGIAQTRLVSKGYGLEQPIVSDEEIKKMRSKREIETAHQENRRTEFKILSN
jgi:outer membrane protein OmpA-like peptidoglycan-associated protein/tetratricopeptide (TPR) repeat protein